MSFYTILRKSLFSTKTLNNNFNYQIYRRPENYLTVSEFIEKFKTIQIDQKDEKVSLTGN